MRREATWDCGRRQRAGDTAGDPGEPATYPWPTQQQAIGTLWFEVGPSAGSLDTNGEATSR